MSRRRAPVRHWHVGDPCLVPTEVHMGVDARYDGGSWTRTYWTRCEVVAVRGDRVVVRRHRWETVHPWWALRVPPKPRGHCHYRYTPVGAAR